MHDITSHLISFFTRSIALLLLFLFPFNLFAAPSSIDSLGLPEAVEARYDLEKVEQIEREELVWYLAFSYFEEGETKVKHGVWIERTRSRDRERHDTDYVEVRKLYDEGQVAAHSVVSTWVNGVMRQRDYILSEELQITLKFNEKGQEVRGPKANARGGRAKRERIIRVFNEVYGLNN